MSLAISGLRVRYGSVTALDGIDLALEPGELFFLLGPSGCGKSTLLRTVAGFIESHEGGIAFGGEALSGVPPHRRDFGMVFQNYALFPHLSVQKNVAFGLEARKTPAAEIRTRVAEALALVDLSGYEARRPGQLSGGQQQRVALARALVIRPRLLLLDEPLSNLDAQLRWEMRAEIKRIHRQTKITTLYVTHDQKEALSLADRLAILKEGRIEALGTPRELYGNPPTKFSASFLGDLNALPGTLKQGGGAKTGAGVGAGAGAKIRTALGEIELPASAKRAGSIPSGSKVTVFCRPENVALTGEDEPSLPGRYALLTSEARVAGSAFLGAHTQYELDLPGSVRWRCIQPERGGAAQAGWDDGARVQVAVEREAWRVLP